MTLPKWLHAKASDNFLECLKKYFEEHTSAGNKGRKHVYRNAYYTGFNACAEIMLEREKVAEEAIKTLQSFHVTEKSMKAAFEAAMRKRNAQIKTPATDGK